MTIDVNHYLDPFSEKIIGYDDWRRLVQDFPTDVALTFESFQFNINLIFVKKILIEIFPISRNARIILNTKKKIIIIKIFLILQ